MSVQTRHHSDDQSQVVIVGSFVVDFSIRVPRLPHLGESLVGNEFYLGPGGKGTNVAVTVARQQQRSSLIARVGDDQFADNAFDLYRREHIDATYVQRTPGISTSIACACIEPSGDNAIAVYLGANEALSPADVSQAEQVFQQASVVMTQFETPNETILRALQLGHSYGAQCILNPAPARPLSHAHLPLIDILTPNKGEARVLVGLEPDDETVGLVELGRRLVEQGVGTVIMTLGAAGCLLMSSDADPLHIPAYKVDVVNTVGAGDAFNGGLAVGLSLGLPLPDAINRATVTAALSCRAMGSIAGLPTFAEVDEHLTRFLKTL
ncbi:MAG: ribokinase [Ktedonobacteraceae bacterium]|nr:ribokinase [Ktedonobacteraceae bacterium]